MQEGRVTKMRIDAKGVYYKQLNEQIKTAVEQGAEEIILDNINGQRYLGTNLDKPVKIIVNGVPGSDMATFMDGPTIIVNGNAQDAIANTMNAGKIVVHGHAGDVVGYGMRGGKLFIKGKIGYRVGIHMKEYGEQKPVLIAGGVAGDFLGEYMAGGVMIVLGLDREASEPITGDYVGTGMHGGVIYLRGEVEPDNLGKEVQVFEVEEADLAQLREYLSEYCQEFGYDLEAIMAERFVKLIPVSARPYGNLYTTL